MHNKSVEWCFIKCRASLVIECAKLGYRSVGVELNLPLVIYSRMATRRNGFFNNEATFYRRDIFKTNMKPYNVSILFAAESVVEMILPKLEEMRPGTHLVMCRFPIPTTTNTLWTLVDREGDDKTPGMNNAEREMMKRAKQAEAARQRYHRLTPDEKKDLYLKRTLAQKGKRQLEKELSDSGVQYQTPTHNAKYAIKNELNPSLDKSEQEMMKRAKQAEAALQRYHCLTPDEKKDLNLKRTLAQKRKRQREKELSELEQILRMTNDIFDDPEVTEQLREKRMRARWAEAARTRYQRMSSEERRHHNTKRRLRQTKGGDKPEPDDEASRIRLREQNIKKAEAARLRYHRMSAEEKKLYNQRRTEAFRLRRMEEEALLEISIERINGEALDRVQQIVVRNARRAEAARLRYQRMTPEQRKLYNQRRHAQKRKREQTSEGSIIEASGTGKRQRKKEHELLAKALLQYETFKADETQKVIQGEDISQQKKAQIEHKLADNGGVSNEHHAGLAIPTPASRMHSMFLIKTENEKLKN